MSHVPIELCLMTETSLIFCQFIPGKFYAPDSGGVFIFCNARAGFKEWVIIIL